MTSIKDYWTKDILNDKIKGGGIYFVQAGNGFIKIGNSENVLRRFNSLQSMSPVQIWLSGLIPTLEYKKNEEFQHQIWDIFRISGEWFAPCPPLINYLSYFVNGFGWALEFINREPRNYDELIELQKKSWVDQIATTWQG
jgi:hypothetical protein